jgi:membrane-associated protein
LFARFDLGWFRRLLKAVCYTFEHDRYGYILVELIDLILHVDEHLAAAITRLGPATYALLFGIIFAETGLVIFPFLPGDSLLFAAGSLAGGGLLDIWIVLITLLIAAVLGDTVNYWIGHRIGERVFSRQTARFFKPSHLARTQAFYAKHGGKTIILARFVPIVRTFAPFVAGVGRMRYSTFVFYNLAGALLWVVGLTLAGFFFGRIPVVKHNFELVVLGIILVSILPPIIEFIKHKRSPAAAPQPASYKDLRQTFDQEHISE